MTTASATDPVIEVYEIEHDCAAVTTTGRFAVLRSLIRNWTVLRAVALAVATVVLLALRHGAWVPFAVSAYAISNATAITLGSARAARDR